MKTSSAKAKGRRLSQAVKDAFHIAFPDLQSDDIVVTPSGVTGSDLHLSPKAQEVLPFVVECKNHEKLNIWDALAQSETHVKKESDIPITCFTRNRAGKVFVALDLNNFLKLIKHEKAQ
jgi:hypothetical protein